MPQSASEAGTVRVRQTLRRRPDRADRISGECVFSGLAAVHWHRKKYLRRTTTERRPMPLNESALLTGEETALVGELLGESRRNLKNFGRGVYEADAKVKIARIDAILAKLGETGIPVPVLNSAKDRVSWCAPDGCQASTCGLVCENCENDITHERHAVVTEDEDPGLVYSLCEPCARLGRIPGASART